MALWLWLFGPRASESGDITSAGSGSTPGPATAAHGFHVAFALGAPAVPQGTPAALPSPILRRLSRPSASGAAPRSAWLGAAPAGRPQRAGGTAGRHWGGAARTCHVPCLSALGSLCRTEVSFTSGDYVGFGTQELHQPCAFTRPSVKSAHLPHSPG